MTDTIELATLIMVDCGLSTPISMEESNSTRDRIAERIEAWLQAEILKRLGEPVGYIADETMKYGRGIIGNKYTTTERNPVYLLPSLATPEERKDKHA